MKNFKKIFAAVLMALLILTVISCKTDAVNDGKAALNETSLTSGDQQLIEESQNTVLQNPKSSIISTLKISGQAIDLKISGDYLYVTNDLGYLYVVDIKDRKNPEVQGKCSGIDAANIVFIEKDYVYISYSKYDIKSKELKVDYGFKIVDIKNKKQPKVIGDWGGQSTGTDKSVHGMFVKDDHVFLTIVSVNEKKSTSIFQVVDVSNKSKPYSAGSFQLDGSANAVWAAGDYAFINLLVYEAITDTSLSLKDLKSKSYFMIIDVKDKKSLKISGSCEVPTESWGLYADENYAYLSNNRYDSETKKYHDSSIQIIDLKDKKAPVPLGNCQIKGGAWEIDYKDDYLFVSNLEGGFSIIDVKDKKLPKIAELLKTKGSTYDIEVSGSYGYLADGFEGLKIFKLENTESSTSQTGGESRNSKPDANIEISGDAVNYDNISNIYTFSVNNPAYFSGLSSIDSDGDDLNYNWDIRGPDYNFVKSYTPSNDKLSIVFLKTGEYEITLNVSDGELKDSEKIRIKIVSNNIPVNLIKNHEFTVEVITEITNNSTFVLKNLECFTKAPQNYFPFQEIINLNSNSENQEIFFDNDFNKILHFKYYSLEPGKSFSSSLKCTVEMPELSLKKIKSSQYFYDENDPDLKMYTTEDLFIDSDNEVIINAAKKVAGNEKDPVIIAKKLYGFVINKLEYDYERAKDKNYSFYYGSEVLDIGKGVCADYAILYTALLRASKIPARIAAGVPVEAIISRADKTLSSGHAWVEIKLPGYGWIPVDVTSEDSFMPRKLYLNLVMERGSSFLHKSVTMDWYSYYFDGFNYTWDGSEKPDVDQDISYKIYDLDNSDLSVYN
ncbi:MAG: hypothetical protein M1409_05025 [Actinobacteria bacterium]|nr:hypothetical protein [Actinomycetota bacterium]